MNGLEILGKGNLSEESFPFPKSTRVESATPFPKFFVPIESPFTILSEAGCLWNTLFESGNTLPPHPSPPNPFDFFPFFSESMSPFHTRPILKKHTLEWARRLGETRKSALASSPFRLAPVSYAGDLHVRHRRSEKPCGYGGGRAQPRRPSHYQREAGGRADRRNPGNGRQRGRRQNPRLLAYRGGESR